jgi:hypothetical protein
MTLRHDHDPEALFVAFNTRHEGTIVELPDAGHEREWRLVMDTGKPAPYDFLAVDDVLTYENMESALAQAAAWTTQGAYAMLPWSCVVLESVKEGFGENVCGIDRWDDMSSGSEEVPGAPGASLADAEAESDGPVEASGSENVTLTFGVGLREQQSDNRPGQPKQQVDSGVSSTQASPLTQARPAPVPGVPWRAVPQQAPQPAQETMAVDSGGESDWGSDETELRALMTELLGTASNLDAMNPTERAEMLNILRENLELRKRLDKG